MPGKNLKQTTQKSEPVVEATTQKGGKKTTATKIETTSTPVVEATPQKGGKKTTTKVEATSVPAKVEAAPQKGGKKTTTAPASALVPAKVEVTATKGVKKDPVAAAKTELKGGKKAATSKSEKKPVKKAETDVEGEDIDRHVRSFKVRLPGKEEFEGRFTGLTPYQAANKALSKYFRETEKPQTKITFSICESTRKSRRATYTYIGQRQKLDIPVSYKIADGREIVKNFKNSLKKVKKSEASESA